MNNVDPFSIAVPPAENFAEPAMQKQLEAIAKQLYKNAEVIVDYSGVYKEKHFSARSKDVFALLKRRPCSIEDIAAGLGLHINEVVKYIERLTLAEKIETDVRNQKLYYRAKL